MTALRPSRSRPAAFPAPGFPVPSAVIRTAVATLVSLAALTRPVPAAEEPLLPALTPAGEDEVVEDIVYEVYSQMLGEDRKHPGGRQYRRVVRRGDTLIVSEQSRMKIKGLGGVVDISMDSTTVEDLAGRLLAFDYIDSTKDLRISGKLLRTGRLAVSQTEDGRTVEKAVRVGGMLTENGNVRLMLSRLPPKPPTAGRGWRLDEFHPTKILDGPCPLKFEYLGEEVGVYRGEPVTLYRFRQTEEPRNERPLSSNVTEFWADRAGIVHKLQMQPGGGRVTVTFERIR
jgi:hypothetical protein